MPETGIAYDGKVYEDEAAFEAAMNPNIPPSLKRIYITKEDPFEKKGTDPGDDSMVKTPNEVETGRQLDQAEIDPTTGLGLDIAYRMPLESPTEPAGALKSTEGSQTPEKAPETNFFSRLSIANAIKGMASPNFEEDKKILSGIWDTIKNGLSLTQAPAWAEDPVTGEIHTSPQAIEKAADLAGIMVFGPAPVAKGMADGTLGSFAGVRAKGFDKNKLAQAQIMESYGIHPDEIFSKTGMFRGAEGRWRFEISDKAAKINPNWSSLESVGEDFKKHGIALDTLYGPGGKNNTYSLRKWKTNEKINPEDLPAELKDSWTALNKGMVSKKLPEVYNHPELYEAYPVLKKIQVIENKNLDSIGAWSVNRLAVEINPDKLAQSGWTMKEIMAHELQHAIQDIEGFAKGGAAVHLQEGKKGLYKLKYELDDKALTAVREAINNIISKHREGKALTPKELDDLGYFGRLLGKHAEYVKAANLEADMNYWKLAGEAEARNVQNRSELAPEVASNYHPSWTEDVPRNQQIMVDIPAHTTAYGAIDPKTNKFVKSPRSAADDPTNFRRAANDNNPPKTIKELEERAGEVEANQKKAEVRLARMKELSAEMDKLLEKDKLTEFEKKRLAKLEADWEKAFEDVP